jgi:molecular chaperone GrpE
MESSERRDPWAGDPSQAFSADAARSQAGRPEPPQGSEAVPLRTYVSAYQPAPETVSEAAPVAAPEPAVDRQAALRALRNLEATEARLERNARRDAEEARGKLVQELLPVLDNLDRTIAAAHAGRSDPAMLEGVHMVRKQLEGVLRGYGVERIEAVGQRFDPALHEAIGMISVSDPEHHGVVVHQTEPGYQFGGRLLRAAKVSVGKLVAPFDLRPASMWR